MAGSRVHVELGLSDDSGRAIVGARGTLFESDGTTPLAGAKSAASGGSDISYVTTGATGKAEFWVAGLPRQFKVTWSDNSLTATPAGSANPLASFSVQRGPHDMIPPPLEAAQLDEDQTWTGANDFVGGLLVDGVAVATSTSVEVVEASIPGLIAATGVTRMAHGTEVGRATLFDTPDIVIEVTCHWGIDATLGPYYDEDGATPGEEALMRIGDDGEISWLLLTEVH